jgi:glycosyltransferase involved in cell wall biosynthesis
MPDGYLARLYAKRYNTPYIVTFRNADVKFLKKLDLTAPDTEKAFLVVRDAAKILTLNKAIKDFVDGLFGVDSIILPHGIRDEVFAAHKKPISEKVTISVVAKAIQRKNIDWVIHAVKNYQGPQDVMLNIVGDGPLSDELKELASDDMRIQFLGKLGFEDVLQTLKESDIFALPSTDETFGMVYPEAAANHNAIIGLQHEGVWGIFEDGKEMLFSKDEADFQKMLHQLIDNKKLRNTLAENAFAKAKKLTWPVIAREYEEMYNNIIRESKDGQMV